MELSKREIAWQQRKAKSHPTYDMWGKYAGTLQQRMSKVKAVDPYSKEGQKLQEESRKKYGAWWLFTDNKMQKKNCKGWIMQYYVPEGITNK
jgi:hypothetical protein|tara:strand:- start:388 stop:663 length:276 start_codon:yes stop_codon:yes gene_type:complete